MKRHDMSFRLSEPASRRLFFLVGRRGAKSTGRPKKSDGLSVCARHGARCASTDRPGWYPADERRGHAFCRYADDCNVYVRSQRAGERVMASLTRFLAERLKLVVNGAKSAVDRPWKRTFLGYTMTAHQTPRLLIAASSVARFKDKLRAAFRAGRGRAPAATVKDLTPTLRGWIAYFRLAEGKGVLEDLDGWLRRKLRCILWRQWKRPRTRLMRLMQRGLTEQRARDSAGNGRGPWWNAGASHMNRAFRKAFFDQLGLISLQQEFRRLNHAS
jgi:RNA-directed DNA polymerase